MSANDFILIGIDGGATEVKSHHIVVEEVDGKPVFKIGEANSSRKWEFVDGFEPVDVQEQLKQYREGVVNLTEIEEKQVPNYIDAAYETVKEISDKVGIKKVLIGMGMPGLKTPDGRGIAVILNGGRTPKFMEMLEAKLAENGIELVAPIYALLSDAVCCGIGEEYAIDGQLKNLKNGYYMGGGTGVADAMKLKGSLISFDDMKEWMQKSWQMISSLGVTYEKCTSAKSMNTLYAQMTKTTHDEFVDKGEFPQDLALKGDPIAKAVMTIVGQILAGLLFERIWTVKNGREELAYRGEAYLALKKDHPFNGTILDAVVLGQRIGWIYGREEYAEIFKNPVEAALAKLIVDSGDEELKASYLENDKLKDGKVIVSDLRAAPAIGAGIDAYKHWQDNN